MRPDSAWKRRPGVSEQNLLHISQGTSFRKKMQDRCLFPAKEKRMKRNSTFWWTLKRSSFHRDLGEEEQEPAWLDLEADILKVGHHGSRYSTSEAFLQAIRPKLAVISCAKENRYGHPAPETVQRLERAACRIFYTMKTGPSPFIRPTEKGLEIGTEIR